MRRVEQSTIWSTAGGVIVSSKVVVIKGGEAGGRWYRVDVAYEYTVDGRPYRGTRIRFGYRGDAKLDAADGLAATYHVGRTVAVRHDPRGPEQALLRTGDDSLLGPEFKSRLGLVVGILIAFAGFVVFASG